MNKNRFQDLPGHEQEAIRRKAVESVLAGKKQIDVAMSTGVTRQAVSKWLKAYREGGPDALKPRKRGRPPRKRQPEQ